MVNNGWIKIYRSIESWEWYTDSIALHLFLHLLIKANHADNRWQGIVIKRGQLVTSLSSLSSATGISVKKIRNRLDKLAQSKEIIVKTTNRFSIITVCNYDSYQSTDDDEGQAEGKQKAIKGQSKGNQRATNKNEKNEKNIYIDNGEKIQLGGITNLISPVSSFLEECRQDLISSDARIESLMLGLSGAGYITDVENERAYITSTLAGEFVLHANSSGEIEGRKKDDVFKHFANWVRQQYKFKNKKNETNRKANQYDEGRDERRQSLAAGLYKALQDLSE